MNRYASTFIVGLKEVVKGMLQALYPDIEILFLLDGLIVYQGNLSVSSVKKLRFVTNSYIVLDVYKNLGNNPIQKMLTTVSRDDDLERKLYAQIKKVHTGKTFRVVVSDKNQFVSVRKDLLESIEHKVSGIKGLRVNRAKPHTEFWFLNRSEGYGFFLMRLTTHTAYEKILEKGELKPELAHLLCFLSEPNENDIFLDPFCGSGAIPIERALSFPYNMIFASDKDPQKKKFVRKRLKNERVKGTFIVKEQDALNLTSFENNFIHKIVTDPPWGLFEKLNVNIGNFYALMLGELCRVLRKGGIIVILTARKDEFEQVVASMEGDLELLNRYDILVSGKKAAVYKILKNSD
jgi:tRNA (guanine6-N2)-methyltransferase